MPLAREVSDFTAIARSSLYAAIGDDRPPSGLPIPHNASPPEVFVGRLSSVANLRHAARHAGLHRPTAKDVLRRTSGIAIEHQQKAFARLTFGTLRYEASWAFSEKHHDGAPGKRDRHDHRSVWTHVWIEEVTGLIPRWVVGPGPLDLPAPQSPEAREVDQLLTLKTWVESKPAGFARKIHLHAQALAFWVLHHNFCKPAAGIGSTPAMLHGVAQRPWTARDVAALAAAPEAARVSA